MDARGSTALAISSHEAHSFNVLRRKYRAVVWHGIRFAAAGPSGEGQERGCSALSACVKRQPVAGQKRLRVTDVIEM